MNKKYIWIILLCFVLIGGYLRFNMIDSPALNYHNMKSATENLAEAKLMLSNPNECILHRCTYFFWGLEPGEYKDGSSVFEEYNQLPILPWLTAIGWTLLGTQPIWLPRLIIILFSLASIIVMYFLVKRLTENEYIALLSSFLFAVMPLGVFFGGIAIQPDMPALFFSILSIYAFLGWRESFKKKDLFFSILFLGISALFKETFLITVIPLLFLVPWKRIKEILPQSGYAILGILPYLILQGWYYLIIFNRDKIVGESLSLSFSRIIDINYWISIYPSLQSYWADNFTINLVSATAVTLIFAIQKYKTTLGKLIIGFFIAMIPYCGILSGKIAGHAYYMVPFLPLVCIGSAYFLYTLGDQFAQLTKNKYLFYVPLILLIVIMPSMAQANDRVFGTVFFGQDVAGEYIKTHTLPTDRIFAYRQSQEFAVCTYAERRCGVPGNNSNGNIWNLQTQANGTMPDVEKEFNINYIVLSQYGMQVAQQSSNWDYIQNNYHIAWVGAIGTDKQLVPYNFILKKGGKLNFSDINDVQPYLAKTYKMSYGDVPYYVIEP